MAKWVYRFSEGNASMRPLLGGKGANLAEMTGLGMPIPQGFTVTTDALAPDLTETKRGSCISPNFFPLYSSSQPIASNI